MGRLYALGGGHCPTRTDSFRIQKDDIHGADGRPFASDDRLLKFLRDDFDGFRNTGFPTSVFVGEDFPEMQKADWYGCSDDDELLEDKDEVLTETKKHDISNRCPQIEELEKHDMRSVISSEPAAMKEDDGSWNVSTEGMTEFENIMLMMFLSMANL